MKSAKFSTLEKYRFLTSSNAVIRLVGGVLLVALFTLVPNRVSALSVSTYPSSNTFFNTNHRISGGCLTTTVSLQNDISWFVGDSINNIQDPCNYKTVTSNGQTTLSYDSSMGKGYSNIYYNGLNKTTDTYSYIGGSTSLTNSTSGFNAIPRSMRNAVTGYSFNFGNIGNNSTDFNTPILDSDASDSYTLFLYTFNSAMGTAGFTPDFRSSIEVYDLNGNDISETTLGDTTYEGYVYDKIKTSVNFSCGLVSSLTPIPEQFDTSSFTDDTCFITFVIPTSANYTVRIKNNFAFNGGAFDYNLKDSNGNLIPSWRLSMFQMQPSYKDLGTNWSQDSEISLKHDLPVLQILIPQTKSDAEYLVNFANTLYDNHSNNMNNYGTPPNNSIYQNWWDVFTISFVFPFRSFFSSFSNEHCVNIPIIASMVHSSSTQYCTWWSSDIRNVLTPVFSLFSLALLTGFIMHWLSERSTTINISGGKE